MIMTVLKTDVINSKQIRLVEDCYVDCGYAASHDFAVYTNEFKIQIKFLFFWITIKSYGYTYDVYAQPYEVESEIAYQKQCAEETFDFLINN